ncbi:MAG: ABC transporter permease [Blastocatellia bacterium]|nr:ABC transporter permease [Blastocatellia bacterium]
MQHHGNLHLWLIRLIGVLVPQRLRADWRQEWEAELQYRELMLAEWDRLNWKTKLDLWRRSIGALWDALLLQPRRWEDAMIQDLRYAVRMLLKHPGFTVIAVLTLAIGIGANITIFSVVNAVLLRPLPYPDAEQLVFLWTESPQRNIKERSSAYANIADWRSQSQSFADIAIFDPTVVTLTGAAEPEPVVSVGVSANLFSVLGAAPLLGRTFTADDEQRRVVVLSYGLWQRRFGASPDIIKDGGQMVEIDGAQAQVVGVMPERFQFPDQAAQVWRPTLAGEAEKKQAR